MKILLIEGHPDEGAVVLNGTELLDLLPDNIQETIPDDFPEEKECSSKHKFVITCKIERVTDDKEAITKATYGW